MSTPARLRLVSVLVLLVISVALPSAADVFDSPPFSADSAELLKAAAAVTPEGDDGVTVFLDETTFVVAANGLTRRTHRVIYRVDSQAAVEGWSSIEAEWSAWYDEPPHIDARVIGADGTVRRIDPASFSSADVEDEPSMFTDSRMMHGPLPAVAPGSVIEQVITHQQKNPLADAGVSHRVMLGVFGKTIRSRITIEHPASITLHLANRTAPRIEPVTSRQGDTVTVAFRGTDVPAFEMPEWNSPPDVAPFSHVAFSTGRSWQEVASKYAAIADQQLAGADLSKLAKSLQGKAKTPREITSKLLDHLSRNIRYAGVEFGEGSIVPRKPQQTLANQYGDCKDKALLLVGLLREVGIAADVALLVAGSGVDVDPDLPGLGVFNHVIVVTRGADPMWIDPTDQFSRAGELPAQDQGRWALIANTATTSLTRTPQSSSKDNRRREVREFFLAEDGHARVVETIEYHGEEERSMRRHYSVADSADVKTGLESYVKDAYRAGSLESYEIADPRDLTKPFTIRTVSADAARGFSADGEAAVGIFRAAMFSDLPWDFSAGLEEDEAGAAEPRKPRVNDYVFDVPFSVSVEYRIHPPAGYLLRDAPEAKEEKFGSVSFRSSYSTDSAGIVTGRYEVDSGERRIPAAVYEATKKAVAEVREETAFLLYFDHAGKRHLDAGRVGEAIAEFRKTAELHPKEALHRAQVAQAFLAGGMGWAAREEARRAVELDGRSAVAHRALGLALASDLIGRKYGKGFDRDGAIAAFRKARELDAKDVSARAELAALLARGSDGEPYGDGADLNGAIDEYVAMKKDVEADDVAIDGELMVLYSRTGRTSDLEALIAETTNDKKPAFRIVTAALKSPEAGLKASQSIEPSARRLTTATAAGVLAVLRHYDIARQLIESIAPGAPNASELRSQADLLRRMRRHEELKPDPGKPETVVRELFLAFSRGDFEPDHLLLDDVVKTFDDLETPGGRGASRPGEAGAKAFFLDILLSSMQFVTDGDAETGYRVRVTPLTGGGAELTAFVVRQGDGFRIAALGEIPATIGFHALKLAQAGDVERASRWLDWARELVTGSDSEDAIASHPFTGLWSRAAGKQPASADVKAAAASLMPVSVTSAKAAIPVLLEARARAATEQQWRIDQALLRAYAITKQWSSLVTVADQLAARDADSATLFNTKFSALVELGRKAEADRLAQERLSRFPGDATALRALGNAALRSGEYSRSYEHFTTVLAGTSANSVDFNQRAWLALFTGSDLTEAVETARRSLSISPNSYAALNTLAALYAEQGNSAEARDVLLESLEAGTGELESADWYVVGRIAEAYGIADAARQAYERVDAADKSHGSVYELAQKRLTTLPVAGRAAKAAKRKR